MILKTKQRIKVDKTTDEKIKQLGILLLKSHLMFNKGITMFKVSKRHLISCAEAQI